MMRGWFGTAVLLLALVAAFAYSWHGMRGQAANAESAAATPAPPPEQDRAQPAGKLQQQKQPQPRKQPQRTGAPSSYYFGGYPCASSDCAEDKAGFEWAQRNVVTDADSCTGKTAEFIEGCRVYVYRHRKLG